MSDLAAARQQANEAQRILESEVYQQAWAEARASYLDRLENERDPHVRDKAWMALQIMNISRGYLEGLITQAEGAAALAEKRDEKLKAIPWPARVDRSVA